MRLLIGVFLSILSASAQSPGTITPTGSLNSVRRSHTATLLPNGKVLITGGDSTLSGFPIWSSTELYDTSSGTFGPAGNMTASRSGHTATLLPDGKVLIVGGRAAFGSGAAGDTAQPSAELYDPLAGTFTPTGSMSGPREGHTATLLNNGQVLIAGGIAFKDGKQTELGSAELYDPASGTFIPTGSMLAPRTALTATLLASGKVLMSSYFNYQSENNDDLEHTELYDPASGTFNLSGRAAYPAFELRIASSSLLTNGEVLNTLQDQCDPDDLAELYHPSTGTLDRTANTSGIRGYTTATVLPDGMVLLAGQDFVRRQSPYASAEIYDPAAGVFSTTITTRSEGGHTATLLPDGSVLLAGGWICCGLTIATADIYRPSVLKPSPVLFSVSNSRQGAVLHGSTQQLVSTDNPAAAGEALEIYGTGLIPDSVIPPQVAIGGRAAEVLFFGDAPGFQGLNQINVRVPASIVPGSTVPMLLNYLGRPSNEVTIAVH